MTNILCVKVPGVNLPMSQLGNYMTALAVGGILHELGHALAAGRYKTNQILEAIISNCCFSREGIAILGCRAHLIIMLPVAAVEISTQRLNSLPSWRRLRILCAGVWHNVVLSLVALMLLYAISHSPLYKLDQGVVVTSVDQV
jgi:S2P endopeptidase